MVFALINAVKTITNYLQISVQLAINNVINALVIIKIIVVNVKVFLNWEMVIV